MHFSLKVQTVVFLQCFFFLGESYHNAFAEDTSASFTIQTPRKQYFDSNDRKRRGAAGITQLSSYDISRIRYEECFRNSVGKVKTQIQQTSEQRGEFWVGEVKPGFTDSLSGGLNGARDCHNNTAQIAERQTLGTVEPEVNADASAATDAANNALTEIDDENAASLFDENGTFIGDDGSNLLGLPSGSLIRGTLAGHSLDSILSNIDPKKINPNVAQVLQTDLKHRAELDDKTGLNRDKGGDLQVVGKSSSSSLGKGGRNSRKKRNKKQKLITDPKEALNKYFGKYKKKTAPNERSRTKKSNKTGKSVGSHNLKIAKKNSSVVTEMQNRVPTNDPLAEPEHESNESLLTTIDKSSPIYNKSIFQMISYQYRQRFIELRTMDGYIRKMGTEKKSIHEIIKQ